MSNTDKDNGTFSNSKDFLNTLARGLKVIESFHDVSSLTISEAAEKNNLSRPATRRILLTLNELGYVKLKGRSFSPTSKLLTLGYSYLSEHKIWEFTQPFLEQLSNKVGESSSIGILDEQHVVYVARFSMNRIMQYSVSVGKRLPAYATSVGKVLLASLSEEDLNNYFKNAQLEPFTEKTITDKSELKKELLEIKEQGWAYSQDQLEIGELSVAVPLYNKKGDVVAALNCPTHSGRVSIKGLINDHLPIVMETADRINKSEEINYI